MNDKQDGDVGLSESEIDTVTVNTLPESAIARLRAEADGALGVDPYSTADSGDPQDRAASNLGRHAPA